MCSWHFVSFLCVKFVLFFAPNLTFDLYLDFYLFLRPPGILFWTLRTFQKQRRPVHLYGPLYFKMAAPDPQPSTSAVSDARASSSSGAVVNFTDGVYDQKNLHVDEPKNMTNWTMLFKKLQTREQCVEFAETHRLIPKSKKCRLHRMPMRIVYGKNKNVGHFVCNKGDCRARSKVARGNGTWFENVKISMLRVYYLMYAFAHRGSYDCVVFEDPERDMGGSLSMATIANWFNYCRETVVLYQLNIQENIGKIGGPGKVVQIDESKFGERKYNRGRHIEGHWVLGLIEDGSEDLRLEICPDNLRSAEVLVPLIQKHVAEGSIIHTDCWSAYDCLGSYGYIHEKMNHSDPENPVAASYGTHTQRIESQWRVVKNYFKKDNVINSNDFSDMIVEYMWRRRVKQNKKDLFFSLIKAINYVYPVE